MAEMFHCVVGPAGFSVTDLKTIQDWILLRGSSRCRA
jgi:hypothetical protein